MARKGSTAWPVTFTTGGLDAAGSPVNVTLAIDGQGNLTVVSVDVFPREPPAPKP